MKTFVDHIGSDRLAPFVYIWIFNAEVWREVWWGRRESVTNDVTERNHIWPPSAMEKDQDSKALAVLMGIIISGKWDSFGGSEIEKKKKRVNIKEQ